MMKLYEIVNAKYEPKHHVPLYLIRVTVIGHTSFTSEKSRYTLWYIGNSNRFRKLEFGQSKNEAYCYLHFATAVKIMESIKELRTWDFEKQAGLYSITQFDVSLIKVLIIKSHPSFQHSINEEEIKPNDIEKYKLRKKLCLL